MVAWSILACVKNDDRRKALGNMLMDVAKYLATVGLIGGALTNSLTLVGDFILMVLVAVLAASAFYIIPRKGELP
jgi:hypothetical protein